MAEPFGIFAGAVSIASAFTACVDCFEYIQLGRHFGRDFQTNLITLDCARLRLTRWGTAVDVYGDAKLGHPEATTAEIQTAKDTMFQILALFADTDNISKKYRLDARSSDNLPTYLPSDMVGRITALHNKMRELAIKRQNGSTFLKATSWAIHDRSELKQLTDEVVVLIDNLEKLFPGAAGRARLVEQEVKEIPNPQDLQLIAKCAEGVDSLLEDTAKKALIGHRYSNIDIKGHALTGDLIAQDWQGSMAGASHTYNGLTVGEGAKALIGNQLGGKGFWED
ncbi:hypothetical protein V490_06715 [Pseudogymnoascus sp. VKM F-3557]|nr:hypothetical protein V490_06715 [Pseudogymnoascus sp. VKM F-3557]